MIADRSSQVPDPNIAISVKDLGKKYHLYDSPKHRLREALHPFRKKYHREFWALKDVSLKVAKGECFGIIGKNGSGKSTLLQLLCGVLQPTTGTCAIRGRMSSLLELGTGFDPELTGRENVYMNGAIIGFDKARMDGRIDSIIEFADIGDFIDQPVKTYSSGMFVRLAFAAAVNVDPDILIIDEALAVGDLRFQKKCKEKMNEFKDRGKTIILVSHSMSEISTMCQKALFLQNGKPVLIGEPSAVINAYTYEESKSENQRTHQPPDAASLGRALPTSYGGNRGGTNDIFITNVACYQKGKEGRTPEIDFGEDIIIDFDYDAVNRIEKPIFRVNFSMGAYKFFANMDSTASGARIAFIEGTGKVRFEIIRPNLYPQAYKINIAVLTENLSAHLFFWNEISGFVVRPPEDRLMAYPTAVVALASKACVLPDHGGDPGVSEVMAFNFSVDARRQDGKAIATANMAPIVFFAFKRPHHTRRALEALSKCEGAENSHLFIFCDGSRGASDADGVQQVRSLVREQQWAEKVTIIEQECNQGLADSIIRGVTYITNLLGRAIVIEDDLIVSRYFLRYMNDALKIYEDTPKVMHIAGYTHPVRGVLPETFFYRVPSCWGWATWKRAWSHFEANAADLVHAIKKGNHSHEFNIEGSRDFLNMLQLQADGKLDSWAIRWYASVFMNQGLCLHPGRSLVRNIGHDGSGSHCPPTDRYLVSPSLEPVRNFATDLSEDGQAVEEIRKFLVGLRI